MNKITSIAINKEKFNLLLILFGVLLCIPFSVFLNIVNKYVNLVILLLISFHMLKVSVLSRRKKFKAFLITIIVLALFSMYYLIGGYAYLNNLLIQIVYIIFTLSIYMYFNSEDRIATATRYFLRIILFISFITIITFLISNLGLIQFPTIDIGGYSVGYNFLLGGVSYGRELNRPQYYFSEPSYLGFYLGFSVFFLYNYTVSKISKAKLLLVLLAGIMVLSFTFYFAIVAGVISELISRFLKRFYKTETVSLIFFISFILFSVLYVSQISRFSNVTVNETVQSFSERNERIDASLYTINRMDIREVFLGKGTGYITFLDNNRELGESNAYIRTFVENGILLLLIYLLIIFYYLKDSPSLLLYTLVALHSVVILETPMFFLLILLSSTISRERAVRENCEL